MPDMNRQWRLVSYPEGMPSESDWEMSEGPIPEPGDGEMLVRSIYLDVAPYMRARISSQKNYAAGVGPGDVMLGGAIGEVVRSNSPAYKAGDYVVSDFTFGWQDYAVISPSVVRRIDTDLAPLPCWLDFMGVNGLTACTSLYPLQSKYPGRVTRSSRQCGSRQDPNVISRKRTHSRIASAPTA